MLRLTDDYWAAEDENILMEPTFYLGRTVVRPLIMGDTAYPNKTWLIRPFKDDGGLTPNQRNFNQEVSTGENSIWPRIWYDQRKVEGFT